MTRNFILPFFLLLLLTCQRLSAQKTEDVVILKNGTVVHGVLMKDTSGNHVRVINHYGDIWVFEKKDVDSLKKERPYEYIAKTFNRAGFEFDMNAACMVRSTSNAIGSANIVGFNAFFGYRGKKACSSGAEIGLEFYDWMEIPVSASFRLRTSYRALSPFLAFRLGYTIPAEKRPNDWDYSYTGLGGYHSSVGFGIERIINSNSSFIISFTYHYQELNYHLTPLYQYLQNRSRTETYSRFRLSLGYAFR